MREFEKEHFKACLHNPLEEDFFHNSDRLQEICSNERTMAYIIMVYDPNSPLRKEYGELPLRKKAAAELSGFNLEEADTDPTDEFLNSVIDFLKLVNNRLWASIVSIEAVIWEMTGKLIKPIEMVGAGADKDRLAAVNMKPTTANSLVELNEMLDKLLIKFYGGDDIVKKKADSRPLGSDPQSVAKALKEANENV